MSSATIQKLRVQEIRNETEIIL